MACCQLTSLNQLTSEESKKIEIKDSSKSNNEKFISLENGKSNRQK